VLKSVCNPVYRVIDCELISVLEDSYYVAFPNDQKYLKCLVYGVLVLETIQTGLATSNAFDTFATGFMQPDASDKVHLSWLTAPILSGIGLYTS
jgi:hypothetical protein